MLEKILHRVLAKILIEQFKKIEKMDVMEGTLKIAYKNPIIKGTWKKFVPSVISLLKDWQDEASRCLDFDKSD